MKHLLKRTWAEINLDNIKDNYLKIKNLVEKNTKVMAVVKADGYGHGDVIVAKTLEDAGADWFGVSNIEEAVLLRKGGISCKILIFGMTPLSMINVLEKWNLTQTIYSLEYGEKLNRKAKELGMKIDCHLKIDTGMGRLGITINHENFLGKIPDLKSVYGLKNLNISGIYTHFSSADEKDEKSILYTKNQFELFMKVCEELKKSKINLGIRHVCNSAGTTEFPKMHLDMVRVGNLLYGLKPSKEVAKDLDLKAAMVLHSVVALVKKVKKGSGISYGKTFVTKGEIEVATIPIGYADGYFRSLSNIGKAEINGHLVPIIGNICMDMMMVDVTGLKVKEGDLVTLFGDKKEYKIDTSDIADLIGTINYEVVTVLGKRVPRLYIKDKKELTVTTYKGMEI